jgi:hypothetical protein
MIAVDEVRAKVNYVVAVLDEKGRSFGLSRMLWQTQWDDVRAELVELIELLDDTPELEHRPKNIVATVDVPGSSFR